MNKQFLTILGCLMAFFVIGGVLWVDNQNDKMLSTENKPITMQTQIQGLQVEILKEGEGIEVQSGQTAVVHYTGMFTDGKVFDSSIPRGQAFPVQLGAGDVIKGWDLGLVGMKVGEKRKLTISPELGYGADGYPGVIPPAATLVFEVTLEAIQ